MENLKKITKLYEDLQRMKALPVILQAKPASELLSGMLEVLRDQQTEIFNLKGAIYGKK